MKGGRGTRGRFEEQSHLSIARTYLPAWFLPDCVRVSRRCIFADVGAIVQTDDNVPLYRTRRSPDSRRLTIVARLTIPRRPSLRHREDSRVSFIWLLSRYIALRSRNRGRVAPRPPRGKKNGERERERDEDLRFRAYHHPLPWNSLLR